MPVRQVTRLKGENFSLKDECRNVPSAQSLVPHPTSCAKIFLTHKSAFLILPSTKSKFLSINSISIINLELARLILNQNKEAFFLIEDSELWDAAGNFAPQWKYPHAKSKRKTTPKPKRGDIKAWICDRYKIGSRTFDDLLADYNK